MSLLYLNSYFYNFQLALHNANQLATNWKETIKVGEDEDEASPT